MDDKTYGRVTMTRRRFLMYGLVAVGAGAVVGIAGGRLSKKTVTPVRPGENEAIVRNPAFSLRPDAGANVVATVAANGKVIAYRLDEEGLFLWESIPTVVDLPATELPTVASLVAKAVSKYGTGKNGATAVDARRFVHEALAAGLLMSPSARLYRTYEPPTKR